MVTIYPALRTSTSENMRLSVNISNTIHLPNGFYTKPGRLKQRRFTGNTTAAQLSQHKCVLENDKHTHIIISYSWTLP